MPASIPLTTIPGEFPAPIELWGDVDVLGAEAGGNVGSDAHAVYVFCGPCNPIPWIFEAEGLAGFGTAGVNAYAYPTGGADNYIHAHEVLQHGHIDTQALALGAYLLMGRICANAGHYGYFGVSFDGGTTIEDNTYSALNTWEWRPIGQVKVPAKRTKPGVAAEIYVCAVAEAAAGEANVDRYALGPISFGGCAIYHASVAATGVSDFDVVDGTILLDGVVDQSDCIGGTIMATKRDELHVIVEEAACNEVTHAIILAPLCTPQYSLWRHE
jgi:hypothetical protein